MSPVPEYVYPHDLSRTPGLSLRDHIAVEALKAILSNEKLTFGYPKEQLVAASYSYADLMLAEREKGGR